MSNVDPVNFMAVVGTLAALLILANQAWTLFGRFSGRASVPQPLKVEATDRWCPLAQHEDCKKETRGMLRGLEERIAKVDEARRISVSKCYDSFRETLEANRKEQKEDMSALRSEFTSSLNDVHERINDVLIAVSKLQGRQQ